MTGHDTDNLGINQKKFDVWEIHIDSFVRRYGTFAMIIFGRNDHEIFKYDFDSFAVGLSSRQRWRRTV